MSRIGKKVIQIPLGTQTILQGQTITVKGPKGELTCGDLLENIKILK